MPPLFGLAPGGVYRAGPVARTAVRSCRTLSTLPGRNQAVSFLWHYPWPTFAEAIAGRRALPGTVVPWSPDFPRPACASRGRPALWPARYRRRGVRLRVRTVMAALGGKRTLARWPACAR